MIEKVSPPSHGKKFKRESEREKLRDGNVPADHHGTEEGGVIGEAEQPAPPSEKPQAL